MSDLLTINNLSYTRNLKQILNDMSLSVPSGQIVGLLGANGAGKTTLMRLIAGSYVRSKGEILVNGQADRLSRQQNISFTDQANELKSSAQIFKLANFYNNLYEDFDLDTFNKLAESLQLELDQKLSHLSKGNRRKFTIAVTLARRTSLYLLDEPFDGIDSMIRKKIITSIIKWVPEDATVIISDHHVSDVAQLLDQIIIIKDKTIAVQESTETIRDTLGSDVESYYESFYKDGED